MRARTASRPNARSAACRLCAWQSSRRFSTVGWPPRATGTTWSSSSRSRDSQRWPSAATNAHRPPSRSQTARRTAFGTWRGFGEPPGGTVRGRPAAPQRRLRRCSNWSAIARSSTSAKSPDGTAWPSSSAEATSCSYAASPRMATSSNWPGATGVSRPRRAGTGAGAGPGGSANAAGTRSTQGGDAAASPARSGSPAPHPACGGSATGFETSSAAAGRPTGGVSAFVSTAPGAFPAGAGPTPNRSASNMRTCLIVRCRIASRRPGALASVKWGATSTTAVRLSVPSAIVSKTCGWARAARPAWIRLYASSSDMRSFPTQYRNVDEYPASTASLRRSNSAILASSSAVVRRSAEVAATSSRVTASSVR